MTDAYAVYAIARLASWCRVDDSYEQGNVFLGGANNRVMAGDRGGRGVVFKYYGTGSGMHVGEPQDRQQREWLALDVLASTGVVTERIERNLERGFSVFARLPGRDLQKADAETWRRAGPSCGALFVPIVRRALTACEEQLFTWSCCDGFDAQGSLDELIRRSRWLWRRIGQPFDLGASLDRIEARYDGLVAGPTVLVRQDNNPGNLLQQQGLATRLIDWEHFWLGKPSWQVGILLDQECDGMVGIMAGYQAAGGPCCAAGDWPTLLAAAELSCWWRVMWNAYGWRACHGPDPRQTLATDWAVRLRRRLGNLAARQRGIAHSLGHADL